MRLPIYQIDAFTGERFKGNPAAVCPLESWIDDDVMQNIAAENNLSETAFFVETGGRYHLRWFTPKVEVKLCGHATLASAWVLFNELGYKGDEIKFDCLSGELTVHRSGELLSMDFPSQKPSPATMPDGLILAIGLEPLECHKSTKYLLEYATEDDILSIDPDFAMLGRISDLSYIVTAKGKKVDFVSRFFAPAAGIPEDPVTGSAHTVLTPYWAKKLGKKSLHAHQISRRGGEVFCEDRGDRVTISGRAVKYMQGQIEV